MHSSKNSIISELSELVAYKPNRDNYERPPRNQQVGGNACSVCPFIITDSQELTEDRLIYIESNEFNFVEI